ncbi:MAG: 4Fe-4S binding protein [Clostridiales Family XIII bacterium]|jgi:epoxyqueuosine reductase QueG|nr:4Fe-4S binding protein [Clostridiales Family XIII bacterium]
MDERQLKERITENIAGSPDGGVDPAAALRADLAGMRFFDAPVFGVAAADDPMFAQLKNPEAVGAHHLLPQDFLPGARFVLSVFLPYTSRIKDANARAGRMPAGEWLHGRIEGQKFISLLAADAARALRDAGFSAVAPSIDGRFRAVDAAKPAGPLKNGETADPMAGKSYTSNWSERHVAFVCGLGTFGLSKGLITKKGIAGRFFSLVTDLDMEITPRAYTGLYEYCIRCGLCVPPCPAGAISLENGKSHAPCSAFLNETGVLYAPRYGCGKCQVGVPCESRSPVRP